MTRKQLSLILDVMVDALCDRGHETRQKDKELDAMTSGLAAVVNMMKPKYGKEYGEEEQKERFYDVEALLKGAIYSLSWTASPGHHVYDALRSALEIYQEQTALHSESVEKLLKGKDENLHALTSELKMFYKAKSN